jgi:hypothetical protein
MAHIMSDYKIFLSYARADEPLVKPIVQTLRDNEIGVFQDIDSISPGEDFEQKIKACLNSAEKVYVCWCYHASRSEWVHKEVELSLLNHVQVIPLLMDSTPLPESLKSIQGIDYRHMVRHILTLRDIIGKVFPKTLGIATILNAIWVCLVVASIVIWAINSTMLLGPSEPLELPKMLLSTLQVIVIIFAVAALCAAVISAIWWLATKTQTPRQSRRLMEALLSEIHKPH